MLISREQNGLTRRRKEKGVERLDPLDWGRNKVKETKIKNVWWWSGEMRRRGGWESERRRGKRGKETVDIRKSKVKWKEIERD